MGRDPTGEVIGSPDGPLLFTPSPATQNSCHLLPTVSLGLTATPSQDEGAQVSTPAKLREARKPRYGYQTRTPPSLLDKGLEGTWLKLRPSVQKLGQMLGCGCGQKGAIKCPTWAHIRTLGERELVWKVSDPSLAGLSRPGEAHTQVFSRR